MSDPPATGTSAPSGRDSFLLIAGIAGLLTQVAGIVVNVVLLAPPPDPPGLDSPIGELAAYGAAKSSELALGHGIRFFAQILLLIFGIGLYRLVRGREDGPHRGWATLGLMATLWVPAIGLVANSIEGVLVWQAGGLTEQPQLALALWGISNFLWNATAVPFSVMVLGFSLAGRGSGAFPGWLVLLGLAAAGGGLGGAFLTALREPHGADVPVEAFLLLLLPWVIITSIRMIRLRR